MKEVVFTSYGVTGYARVFDGRIWLSRWRLKNDRYAKVWTNDVHKKECDKIRHKIKLYAERHDLKLGQNN